MSAGREHGFWGSRHCTSWSIKSCKSITQINHVYKINGKCRFVPHVHVFLYYSITVLCTITCTCKELLVVAVSCFNHLGNYYEPFLSVFANLRTWHLPIAVNVIRNHSIVINLLLESKYKITSIFTATCSQCVSKVKKYIYLLDFFHMKIFYIFCWLVMYSIYYFNATSKKCSFNGQKFSSTLDSI